MKVPPLLDALSTCGLPIAFLDGNNNMIWASASFIRLLKIEPGFRLCCSIETIIKPLILPVDHRNICSALSADTDTEIHCAPRALNHPSLTIHLGTRLAQYRTLAISSSHAPLEFGQQHPKVDPVTGLGNRTLFEQALNQPFHTDKDTNNAIILIDLDRFQRVNNSLGHGIGDKLLKLVSNRFLKLLCREDMMMRLDGDEFAVIIKDKLETQELIALAERFVERASQTFIVSTHQIDINANVGIAAANVKINNWHQLYHNATLALSVAKQSTSVAACLFTPELEQRAQYRRALEIGLRRGLAKNEFHLAYEPQLDVATKALTGFDVRLEWNSETLGRVSPEKFYPIAEEIGEINRIGRWIIEQAIKEASTWPAGYLLSMTVTLAQLLEKGFTTRLFENMHKYNYKSIYLELVVPEKVLLNLDSKEVIKTLAERGVNIALSDPRTGYESLRELKKLPISRLRVHRDMMQADLSGEMPNNIKEILDVGELLGVPIVAQGLRGEELLQLRQQGAPTLQGIFSSKVLSAQQALGVMKQDHQIKLERRVFYEGHC